MLPTRRCRPCLGPRCARSLVHSNKVEGRLTPHRTARQGKAERLASLALTQALVSRDIQPFSANLSLNLYGIAMLQLVQSTDKIDSELLAALLQTCGP
jgi:hypothetical protein